MMTSMGGFGGGGPSNNFSSGGGGYTGGNGSNGNGAGGGGCYNIDPNGTAELGSYNAGQCTIKYLGK